MHDLGVVHGRFQVLHNDHLVYLLAAKARCRHLVVGVTNPDPSLTRDDPADPTRSRPEANPLTYWERQAVLKAVLSQEGLGLSDFSIVPLPINRPELYRYYVPLKGVFFLTIYDDWGERKLAVFESLGLTTEVLWRRPLAQKGLTSTGVRRLIARGQAWEHLVPPAALRVMKELKVIERIAALAGA